MRLEKYVLALEFNADVIDGMKSRRASALQLATQSSNSYFPLLKLKRHEEAANLLWACKEVFEKERSVEMLGTVFSDLANLTYQLGQVDQAIRFEETALRYKYLFGKPESISIGHNNLAVCLGEAGSNSALDHRLAAAVILYETGSGMLASSLGGLARNLAKFGPEAPAGSFDELGDRVERVEGVRFRELCERLPKRAEDGDRLLKELIAMARGAGL